MRGLVTALVVVSLLPVFVAAEEATEGAEPRIPEREADYGELFPFGVRGLPATYRDVPGGDARLEAMEHGVAWLVAHQAADGSFPANNLAWCNGKEGTTAPGGPGRSLYVTGVSGMAISAILGAGYTPRGKHPYAEALRRGLKYILSQQDPEGCFGPRQTQQYIYNHAFCLLAVIDAYGVTGDSKLRQSVLRGISFSELARNPGFAWRYGIRPGDNDTSATGCVSLPLVAALKINRTAEHVGYVPPFDIPSQAFVGARRFIEAMTDPDYGMVGYLSRGSGSARPQEMLDRFPAEKTAAMTAIAMVVRQIIPGDDPSHDKRMLQLGMKLMTETTPRWSSEGTCDFYYWYYGALATSALGGKAADTWQGAFARTVIRNQRTDGGPCMYAGSWDPAGPWGPDGGRIYATAILMLGLQAPDRMRRFTKGRKDLTEALLEPKLDNDLRARIVAAVGHHKVSGGESALAKALAHEAPQVRVAAATALGKTPGSTKGVRLLVDALGDKALPVQRAAAKSLGRERPMAPRAIPALLAAMQAKDALLRTYAATALGGALTDPAVAAALRAALKDPSARVQVAAAGSLWEHQKNVALVPVWIAALKAADADTRADAAMWLERAATEAASAADALRATLGDEVPWVRARCALALQAVAGDDPKLVGTFSKLLETDEPRVQMLALKALARLGPRARPATKALIRIARRGVLPLQRLALGTLAAIGPAAAEAAPMLWYIVEAGDSRLREPAGKTIANLKLTPSAATSLYVSKLDYKDPELAYGAVAGLADVGAPAVPALVKLLADEDKNKQKGAMRALTRMGAPAAPALDALRDQLSASKDPSVRAWAATAIGAIGPMARLAVSSLIAQLDDRTLSVAVACAKALGAVGPDSEGAVEALGGLLTRKGTRQALAPLTLAALASLGKAGPAAEPMVGKMMWVAADGEQPWNVREAATVALGELGPVAIPKMQGALKGGNQKLAGIACDVLARMGPAAEPALDELMAHLSRKSTTWRDQPGDALAAIGKPALRPLLKLLKDTTSDIRRAAVRAIGRMGPVAKSYSGAVRRLKKDPVTDVREAAKKALAQIKKK